MNKDLANALANYIDVSNRVLAELADAHYWNGKGNKSFRALESCGNALIEALHANPPPVPPATPPATPPAA